MKKPTRIAGAAWAITFVLFFSLLPAGIACAGTQSSPSPAPGTVSGCVEIAGHLSYRGVAALWPAGLGKGPDPRRAIRPPATSTPLGADGCFSLQATPGEYFVGAVVRLTEGGWQGPPRPGDMIFLSPDATGKSFRTIAASGKKVDIGRHSNGWVYPGFMPAETSLTISGTLTDPDGKPRQGLLVFAFLDTSMSGEPLAVSEPSDGNGRYLLRLPESATVYLRAREHYGRRSPTDGGYMGIYGNDVPIPVTVGTDEQAERNLTVILIPPLRERQKQVTETPPSTGKN